MPGIGPGPCFQNVSLDMHVHPLCTPCHTTESVHDINESVPGLFLHIRTDVNVCSTVFSKSKLTPQEGQITFPLGVSKTPIEIHWSKTKFPCFYRYIYI